MLKKEPERTRKRLGKGPKRIRKGSERRNLETPMSGLGKDPQLETAGELGKTPSPPCRGV
jgi:hypothetical protein